MVNKAKHVGKRLRGISTRRFYRTTFEIELLSEDVPVAAGLVDEVARLITEGPGRNTFEQLHPSKCIYYVNRRPRYAIYLSLSDSSELDGAEVAKALEEQAPYASEFFNLTSDGRDLPDEW
jgi:hypothetical protein